MTLDWQCKHFNELSAEEIYQVLRLRIEVFIVEQNCPFQDADNKDQQCYHLCGYHKGDLAAYVRIVPPGLSYKEPSIGRVVTSPAYRGTGAGKVAREMPQLQSFAGKQSSVAQRNARISYQIDDKAGNAHRR